MLFPFMLSGEPVQSIKDILFVNIMLSLDFRTLKEVEVLTDWFLC